MNETADFEKLSIDELKKLKESLEKNKNEKLSISKKNSFAPKLDIIDKFTSIDELLIQSIQETRDLIMEQKETNRQMQINNKLLLALFYKESADGSVVQRDPIAIDTSILEEISRGGAITTRKIDLINQNISGKQVIFEGEFEGGLAEILFTSSTSTTDNKDYSVRILADNDPQYQGTFTEFEARGGTETDMACFEDEINEWYLLQFQNVNFSNKILIEVYDSSAEFIRIYIKYHKST